MPKKGITGHDEWVITEALATALIALEALEPTQFVYDTVYHPSPTPLLEAAAARGIPHAGGLGMLVHQAALSFTLWTGEAAPLAVMSAAASADNET